MLVLTLFAELVIVVILIHCQSQTCLIVLRLRHSYSMCYKIVESSRNFHYGVLNEKERETHTHTSKHICVSWFSIIIQRIGNVFAFDILIWLSVVSCELREMGSWCACINIHNSLKLNTKYTCKMPSRKKKRIQINVFRRKSNFQSDFASKYLH